MVKQIISSAMALAVTLCLLINPTGILRLVILTSFLIVLKKKVLPERLLVQLK